MGQFLSRLLLEAYLQKNVILERLWLEPLGDDVSLLRFDSTVPDDKEVDVILTSGKGITSNLYSVGSRRSVKDNKIFTYAPFQRNQNPNIDPATASEVFKAIKGQSELITMDDIDRQQMLDRGAQMVSEKIGDFFHHDITHVVSAPSSSELAKDFARACLEYRDVKDPEKFVPFKLARRFNDAYRKAVNLDKIHIAPEMFEHTLKNIIEKEPNIDQSVAEARAQKHVDDAEEVLLAAKQSVIRRRAAWDRANEINPQPNTTRPDFSVSEIPHKYRVWIDGFIEPTEDDELKRSSPKIVAVVDDNVDSGHTVFQIAKHLYELGAEHVVGIALYKFTLSAKKESVAQTKAEIDHSAKFWSRPTRTWNKEQCILAKNWLLAMTGKSSKLKIKVPPFDYGFKEKFTGQEEKYLHYVDVQLENLRAKELADKSKTFKESHIRAIIKNYIVENDKHLMRHEIICAKLLGYDIGKMFGSGAMGYVFDARDVKTNEPVVIKFSNSSVEWKGYATAKAARNLLPENLARHIVRIDYADNIRSIPGIEKYTDVENNYGKHSIIVMEKLNPLGTDLQKYYFRPDLFFKSFEEVHEVFKKSLNDTYQDMQYDITLDFLRPHERIKFLHELMNALSKNKNKIEKLMYERTKEQQRGPTDVPDLRRKDILFKQLKEWTEESLAYVIKKWNAQDKFNVICLKISYKMLEEIMYNRQIIRRPSAEQKDAISDEVVGEQFRDLASAVEKLGFAYDDLHEDNLLIRPGTDELVFADVGQFGYITS